MRLARACSKGSLARAAVTGVLLVAVISKERADPAHPNSVRPDAAGLGEAQARFVGAEGAAPLGTGIGTGRGRARRPLTDEQARRV